VGILELAQHSLDGHLVELAALDVLHVPLGHDVMDLLEQASLGRSLGGRTGARLLEEPAAAYQGDDGDGESRGPGASELHVDEELG